MNQQIRTVEEIVLPLALAESPVAWCIPCNLSLDDYTAKAAHKEHDMEVRMVAEFPMLRGPCTGLCGGYGAIWCHRQGHPLEKHDNCAESWTCTNCQGRGWRPVTATDALLEAGKPWELGVCWSLVKQQYQGSSRDITLDRYANTPNKALALMLEAARKQEAADAS